MNEKIKQLDRSIEKSEKRLKELEESVVISISLSKAFEMIELKKAIKELKRKRDVLNDQDQPSSPMDELRQLFESFNPYNN